ncbi:MAG: AMP-binding protein [Myxococcota bacterium]
MSGPNHTLSPLEALSDRHVVLLGTTGFLAKVMLSLLLERFSCRRITCVIRSTRSLSAADRFRDEVLASPLFDPLRRRFGDSFDALVQHQVQVVAGDISKPDLGLSAEDRTALQADADVLINSAGLVTFNPPLDQALDSNTLGAETVARFCQASERAKLVHVSTCFVAGRRSGRIPEDPDVFGRTPSGAEIDWAREVKDLQRAIQQVRERTDDAALEARFRREALTRLEREGREAQERTVRAAMTNQRRRWVTEELTTIGKERAEAWGWPNIYTYTKALGEQAIAAHAELEWAIVRPAIVESAVQYPFPGWNEGMNTSAPLAWMARQGQVVFPGPKDLILDVVPVDYVASATLAASAALCQGESRRIYQVAAGDVNPCSMARTVHLVGIHRRRHVDKQKAEEALPAWKASIAQWARPLPKTRKTYERFGAPGLKKLVSRAKSALDQLEPDRMGPVGEFVHRAKKTAGEIESDLEKIIDVFDLFMPFIWEHRYVFNTKNTRGLFERMSAADRGLLPFDTEGLDWRYYWLDVHLPGLERWVFPKLESDGRERKPIPRDYRDLAELFDTRTREHGRRTAYRILREDDAADGFTFREVRGAALGLAKTLGERGIQKGDRVVLASEGRPEWGIAYFAILLTGGTAVPLDVELSRDEMLNIIESSEAKAVIASPRLASKLGPNGRAPSAPVWSLEGLFQTAEQMPSDAELPVRRRPEDVASIIYTSGTTGSPKGVVLTDRNFTALTARLSAVFDLRKSDALLSVLPPHHTFEFSAGLLMPLATGASVTYLEERTPELIQRAFREAPVTAMIGVPAVWESLHRKIAGSIDERPWLVRRVMELLFRGNRMLRERYGVNVGRILFRPIHARFGGRLRYLVSGGAPLRPAIFNDMVGYGFGIHEGYGLTEAAPVVSVGWPGHRFPAGSVGWPLPGVEVRIHGADVDGIGEVVVRSPTVMNGYLDEPDATRSTLQHGWLHTGDRGRLDEKGRLFIVGRDKDVIIDGSGKNVYPDEIERLYAEVPGVSELCVLGVGEPERVAAMVVPDEAWAKDQGLDGEAHKDEIRRHFKEVGSKLPFPRRVKMLQFQPDALPRTSTQKVRRAELRSRFQVEANKGQSEGSAIMARVQRVAAQVGRVAHADPEDRLDDRLGFDSLMHLELLSALEKEFDGAHIPPEELASAETVSDVARVIERRRGKDADIAHEEEAPVLAVPSVVAKTGKSLLGRAQHFAYDAVLEVEVEGRGNIPANRNFVVVANHASHLDMGLVKYALGEFGRGLRSLAAKDYFFEDPVRRAYFENFTNLLPIERHGSLRRSLRQASEALRDGQSLLIFPEGTRSRDGRMSTFKPAVGYLCLNERVDILPMYLGGTHAALPPGEFRMKAGPLVARIGAPLEVPVLEAETAEMPRARAYRYVSEEAEGRVRRLGGLEPAERQRPTSRTSLREPIR